MKYHVMIQNSSLYTMPQKTLWNTMSWSEIHPYTQWHKNTLKYHVSRSNDLIDSSLYTLAQKHSEIPCLMVQWLTRFVLIHNGTKTLWIPCLMIQWLTRFVLIHNGTKTLWNTVSTIILSQHGSTILLTHIPNASTYRERQTDRWAHDTRTRNSCELTRARNLYVCHTDLQQDISRIK